MNREGNRTTSMVDLAILFSMPVIIAVLCIALWFYGAQLNAAIAQ